MKLLELTAKIRSLPAKQQVGLWVILNKFHKEKGTWFTTADFSIEMQKYLTPDDPQQLARIMGGVMSSLLRNGVIEQFTGGQKPVWTVSPEIRKYAKEIKDSIFPVIAYWEEGR